MNCLSRIGGGTLGEPTLLATLLQRGNAPFGPALLLVNNAEFS